MINGVRQLTQVQPCFNPLDHVSHIDQSETKSAKPSNRFKVGRKPVSMPKISSLKSLMQKSFIDRDQGGGTDFWFMYKVKICAD